MAEEGEEEVREKEPQTEGFAMCRKEKRKASKKMKRKQARKEMAVKEREEEEARINDPEEQIRIKLMEQEEAERSERARKEFEERERAWLEAMETKRKMEEEEEQRRKALDDESQRQQDENANESDENDDWEYVEEGPAEIIWQGNEIIVKKKRVRVPKKKKKVDQLSRKEDTDRPTSNPLPPDSEAFAGNQNSFLSAQDAIESVAQQVPNFGTEQDKAHCPFHLKTGACRFGQRCSRVHFYPDKASALLIKNMYTGPGLAWEQDEGLEYTDEEVERYYEEFYEDVHTEFLKFGEIVNFKVCRNGSFHLRGNVYVHFKSLDSAVLAHHSINGRYFAGKQVRCEFVNVTRWKVAICGEYMKSRFNSCSRGTACNFIHCFRNPGGDYEWADSDKPPPTYWVKKMGALFGYSDESAYERRSSSSRTSTADADRYRSNRSRSRERDYLRHTSSGGRKDTKDYVRRRVDRERCRSDEKEQIRTPDEESEERTEIETHITTKQAEDQDGIVGIARTKLTNLILMEKHTIVVAEKAQKIINAMKIGETRTESEKHSIVALRAQDTEVVILIESALIRTMIMIQSSAMVKSIRNILRNLKKLLKNTENLKESLVAVIVTDLRMKADQGAAENQSIGDIQIARRRVIFLTVMKKLKETITKIGQMMSLNYTVREGIRRNLKRKHKYCCYGYGVDVERNDHVLAFHASNGILSLIVFYFIYLFALLVLEHLINLCGLMVLYVGLRQNGSGNNSNWND